MIESRLEKKIVKALRESGFDSVKVGRNGWPDRLVITGPGHHLWLEVKQPGGSLTAAQKRLIPRMQEQGEPVYVVESVEEAMEIADRHWRLL
jgi:hypothetical protein